MKCAIQLVFSDENQKTINNLRKLLVDFGVHDEAVPINHISLTDIEIEENQIEVIENVLIEFSKSHKQIKLVLSSVGSFMSSENVLFLTPTITEDLTKYNDEIVRTLLEKNVKSGVYYTKNNWQPHCTIAIRLSDDELFEGFKVLKNNNILPLEVVADKIDLLCYDPKPYKEIFNFELEK